MSGIHTSAISAMRAISAVRANSAISVVRAISVTSAMSAISAIIAISTMRAISAVSANSAISAVSAISAIRANSAISEFDKRKVTKIVLAAMWKYINGGVRGGRAIISFNLRNIKKI